MQLTTTQQDGIITKTITIDSAKDMEDHIDEFDALMSSVQDSAGDLSNITGATFSVSYKEHE